MTCRLVVPCATLQPQIAGNFPCLLGAAIIEPETLPAKNGDHFAKLARMLPDTSGLFAVLCSHFSRPALGGPLALSREQIHLRSKRGWPLGLVEKLEHNRASTDIVRIACQFETLPRTGERNVQNLPNRSGGTVRHHHDPIR